MSRPTKWQTYSASPLAIFAILQIYLYISFPQVILTLLPDCSIGDMAYLIISCSVGGSVAALIMSGMYGQMAIVWGYDYVMVSALLGQIVFAFSLLACVFLKYIGHGSLQSCQYIIFSGALFCGIMGSRNTFIMSIFSIASKATSLADRSTVFGILDASLYVASVVSPLIVSICLYIFNGSIGLLLVGAIAIGVVGICSIAICIPKYEALATVTTVISETELTAVTSVTQPNKNTVDIEAAAANTSYHEHCEKRNESEHLLPGRKDLSESLTAAVPARGQQYGSLPNKGSQLPVDSSTSTSRPPRLEFDPLLTCKQTFSLLCGPISRRASYPIGLTALGFFLFHACTTADYTIRILYLRERLHLHQCAIDVYSSVSGILYILSIIAVPRGLVCIGRYCFPSMELSGAIRVDVTWAVFAMVCRAMYCGIFGQLIALRQAELLLPLLLLCGPAVPRLRAIISKSLPDNIQAQAFVGVASLETLAELLGPAISFLFAWSPSKASWVHMAGPTVCYSLIATGCLFAAMIVIMGDTKQQHKPHGKQHN